MSGRGDLSQKRPSVSIDKLTIEVLSAEVVDIPGTDTKTIVRRTNKSKITQRQKTKHSFISNIAYVWQSIRKVTMKTVYNLYANKDFQSFEHCIQK
jgi:hypothetical protein